MVKVREDHPVAPDGSIDIPSWLEKLKTYVSLKDERVVMEACELARTAADAPGENSVWSEQQGLLPIGLQMADILAELKLDQASLVAAVLYRVVREDRVSLETVREHFGAEVAQLIQGVQGMAVISAIQNPARTQVLGQQQDQLEKVRKMLVSIVDDVRVALIKLAERTCAIRAVKHADRERRQRVAREVFEIYAPLAHRLGIGYIKWELEDLAFRYLKPQDYKKIARLLDEKRVDRENYIQTTMDSIREALAEQGIHAEVSGRVKHIYSIWRKMKRKGVEFKELYDIRAMRIYVDEVRECYAALGIVHALWNHIPKEFDDYIATPKENGYQSLHTAVVGPRGKTLEVQIRTHAMHEEAELGVCAHWKYKGTDTKSESDSYEEKLNWLRQVLDWQEEIGQGMEGLADQWHLDVEPDRVYVFTKDGHVVDLPVGATPVDFAYRVHTEVGSKCRGAKVSGRIVPLNTPLKTGDQLEILTASNASPSRDWLNPSLGYVSTSRARAKIVSWFRRQDRDSNISAGRGMVEAELKRMGIDGIKFDKLAESMKLQDDDELFAKVGSGDLRTLQVVHAAQRMVEPEHQEPATFEFRPRQATKPKSDSDITVQGVGDLLTHMAKCCNPVPGDPIVGYITLGRGVSVHRADCTNALQLREQEPDRVIEVNWGVDHEPESTYPVKVVIEAYDRAGLLRDITMVVANEKVNVTDMRTHTRSDNIANISLIMEISGLEILGVVLAKLNQLPNVLDAHRDRASLVKEKA
ncbi:GTP diphosphokinase [Sansalvadorimonas sp. 2012CJ34-2]|uniref:GTP pyrophosphokinase n=1 Tax=Parendozoicomonas callyspongiae TaxID=2942213 RepID=A0ABT0PLH5_9GAMM|nr:GTP diphosphokinase [Sansalvadorimonas sp. 2012CJ34-2]MCL6271582.1 GTP diphosphokinase [Sansalvadorimonas sp. 2012CJ34-2]